MWPCEVLVSIWEYTPPLSYWSLGIGSRPPVALYGYVGMDYRLLDSLHSLVYDIEDWTEMGLAFCCSGWNRHESILLWDGFFSQITQLVQFSWSKRRSSPINWLNWLLVCANSRGKIVQLWGEHHAIGPRFLQKNQ